MNDLRKKLDAKIERESEKYSADEFKRNPKGFTVAPYCNSHFIEQTYEEGAHAMAEQLVKLVGELEYIYDTLQPSMAEGDGRFEDDDGVWLRVTVREQCVEEVKEVLSDLEAWLDEGEGELHVSEGD